MCEDYDPDCHNGPTILRKAEHTARKTHACDGCQFGGILSGERYTLLVTLDEGSFKLERYCSHKEFDDSVTGCQRDTKHLDYLLKAQSEAYEAGEVEDCQGDAPEQPKRLNR